MQFLAELLEGKWRLKHITKIPFSHNTNAFYKGGVLIKHNNKKRFLTKDEIFYFCMKIMALYILFQEKILLYVKTLPLKL